MISVCDCDTIRNFVGLKIRVLLLQRQDGITNISQKTVCYLTFIEMISSSWYQFENEKEAHVSHFTRTMCKKWLQWRRAKNVTDSGFRSREKDDGNGIIMISNLTISLLVSRMISKFS